MLIALIGSAFMQNSKGIVCKNNTVITFVNNSQNCDLLLTSPCLQTCYKLECHLHWHILARFKHQSHCAQSKQFKHKYHRHINIMKNNTNMLLYSQEKSFDHVCMCLWMTDSYLYYMQTSFSNWSMCFKGLDLSFLSQPSEASQF